MLFQARLFLDLLEVVLLLTALNITWKSSVKGIIATYRFQALVLTAVTILAGLSQHSPEAGITIYLFALLPALLALFIKRLLVRATLSTRSGSAVSATTNKREIRRQREREAEDEWLKYKVTSRSKRDLVVFLLLLLIAFVITVKIEAIDFTQSERVSLFVALTLHLIGIYNMVVKRNIISQVVGLLVMDHGLYLAVVRIVEIPVPATLFLIGLFLYTAITVFILLFLLPKVRKLTNSSDLSEIATSSSLEG